MKELFDKLKKVEDEATTEKGGFVFFGLFLREDAPGKYDLLVSAPWIETNRKEGLEYLAKKISSQLNRDELLALSRIVVLEKDNPVLKAVLGAVHVKQGRMQISNCNFNGISIASASISTACSDIQSLNIRDNTKK